MHFTMEKVDDFDTIILDLDFTVWHGCEPEFWAKKLVAPITRKGLYLRDKSSNFIKLDKDFTSFIQTCSKQGKKIGFITRGGLLDTPFNLQPPVICLKLFKIYPYFNFIKKVIYKTEKKSNYFTSYKKTLYVDDNPLDLQDIDNNINGEVKTLNRNNFKLWTQLLK